MIVICALIYSCIRPVNLVVQATAIIGGGLIYDSFYYMFLDELYNSDAYLYIGHLMIPMIAYCGYLVQVKLGYTNDKQVVTTVLLTEDDYHKGHRHNINDESILTSTHV